MIKNIKELKNIESGNDIYVIGAGPSVDYIDTSFFENKITIGVNQIYRKIKCKYLVRKELSLLEESLKNDSIIICSKYNCGNLNKKLNIVNNHEYYIFNHLQNLGRKIIYPNLENDEIIVSYSTITSAIHIAAYLGASNIILVGHDCGTINGKSTFDKYYNDINETPWENWDKYIEWLSLIEEQTLNTKQFIKDKYNCNIYSLNPFINFNLEGNIFKGKNNINL